MPTAPTPTQRYWTQGSALERVQTPAGEAIAQKRSANGALRGAESAPHRSWREARIERFSVVRRGTPIARMNSWFDLTIVRPA